MKKLLSVVVVFFLMSVIVKAQGITWGVKLGPQSNFLSIKQKTNGEWTRALFSGIGMQAGGVADIGITNHFSIQPNLLFTMKGVNPSSESEITLYTIDLPVNFLYKNNGFFAGFGPNLSYGLSAKQETDGAPDDDLYESNGPGDPAEFNRFEFGVNTLIGYQFKCGLTLNAHYTPGYSNLNNDDDNATETRYNTRVFGFSVGYMFGKKPLKK